MPTHCTLWINPPLSLNTMRSAQHPRLLGLLHNYSFYHDDHLISIEKMALWNTKFRIYLLNNQRKQPTYPFPRFLPMLNSWWQNSELFAVVDALFKRKMAPRSHRITHFTALEIAGLPSSDEIPRQGRRRKQIHAYIICLQSKFCTFNYM